MEAHQLGHKAKKTTLKRDMTFFFFQEKMLFLSRRK